MNRNFYTSAVWHFRFALWTLVGNDTEADRRKKIHINCHVQKEENRTAEKLHKSLLGPEMLKKLHLTQMPTFHPREEINRLL